MRGAAAGLGCAPSSTPSLMKLITIIPHLLLHGPHSLLCPVGWAILLGESAFALPKATALHVGEAGLPLYSKLVGRLNSRPLHSLFSVVVEAGSFTLESPSVTFTAHASLHHIFWV
ncbi:hypothetical protein L7F22_029172, partial [Adiantum nelumboides]|nr:hypothetical protein [Adiantum nelumboides]